MAALLGAVMVKSFILTTLDAGTRLARFLVNETLGKKIPGMGGRWISTAVVLVPAFVLALTNTYSRVWNLFGAANQLIAAVTLLTITSFLARQQMPRRYTLIPAVFMLTTTTAALLWEMFHPQGGYFIGAEPDWFMGTIASVLILLETVVVWQIWRSIRAVDKPHAIAAPEAVTVEKAKHRLAV